jgi:hypothetical protein
MTGLNIQAKTKAKAALKLYNSIYSYLFEQECEELRYNSKAKDALTNAADALKVIIKKYV